MKEIIIKYLKKNYSVTFTSMSDFKVIDIINNQSISMGVLLTSLPSIFSCESKEISKYFLDWFDSESIILNNKLVEVQEHWYAKGYSIDLTQREIIEIIKEEEQIENDIINSRL